MLPLLGLAGSLLGGGASPLVPSEPPAPITQTVTTGAITLGMKNLGRGEVHADAATATGAGSVRTEAAPANNVPVYAIAGAAVVLAAIFALSRKG